jgi:hypothetical protein
MDQRQHRLRAAVIFAPDGSDPRRRAGQVVRRFLRFDRVGLCLSEIRHVRDLERADDAAAGRVSSREKFDFTMSIRNSVDMAMSTGLARRVRLRRRGKD